MISGFVCTTGNELPVMNFTAGATFNPGDLMAIQTDDKVDPVAENGVAAVGWALHGGVDGDTVKVVLPLPGVFKWMPLAGTAYSAPMLGRFYAIAGTTGAQTLDLGDTGNDLLVPVQYDADNARMLVGVLSSARQVTGTKEAS